MEVAVLWAGLDPLYAARKAVTHPGKGILRRDDTYMEAATSLNHPGNIAEFGPTELILGCEWRVFRVDVWRKLPGVA